MMGLKKILFQLLAFTFYLFTSSQTDFKKYPFINIEANVLSIPNSRGHFISFCKKTESSKSLRVVHIGGSHVQAGVWSNEFVKLLQKYFNTSGGGYFAFPYKIAKTNGQSFIKFTSTGKWNVCRALGTYMCEPIGVYPIRLETFDNTFEIGLTINDNSIIKSFNELRIYHNPGADINLKSKSEILQKKYFNERLGYTEFAFQNEIDSLFFQVDKNNGSAFLLNGISFENLSKPGISLAAIGANGASSSTFLKNKFFGEQLSVLNPNLVIISLGVNDTQSKGFQKEEYLENYDTLITRIKNNNPDAIILLTTTSDNFIKRRTSNKKTIAARDAMFELMEKHNVLVWDLFTVMGGQKSIAKWNKAGIAQRDKVHFTIHGYEIIAELMFDAFIKAYNEQLKLN